MGKIANRQSLAILDRGLKSQPFSQFCCIGVFKTNRQSRVSNRSFKSQRRQRFKSRVFKSLAILDLDRASRREKIFDFVREFAVKYFRIVPVRDSTQQNKA